MLPVSKSAKGFAIVLTASSTPVPPSRGHYCVPAHMVLMHPFRDPLTFGPEVCKTAAGVHVGLNSQPDPVAGILIGHEFLVLSDCAFVILTPREERGSPTITLLDALLPSSKTHAVNFGKKGKVYRVVTGSIIIAQTPSNNTFSSASIFLEESEHYNSSVETLQWSLAHFNHIHNRLVIKPPQANHPFFNRNASCTTRVPLTEEWGAAPINANTKRSVKKNKTERRAYVTAGRKQQARGHPAPTRRHPAPHGSRVPHGDPAYPSRGGGARGRGDHREPGH
jgi:hypothetical protein